MNHEKEKKDSVLQSLIQIEQVFKVYPERYLIVNFIYKI